MASGRNNICKQGVSTLLAGIIALVLSTTFFTSTLTSLGLTPNQIMATRIVTPATSSNLAFITGLSNWICKVDD